jgi:hypothetical protein
VWIISQTQAPTIDFTQLGVAAIVCVLLFAWGWTLWQENRRKDAEISRLRDAHMRDNAAIREEQLTRERELVDRLAPLLASAVEILGTAPENFKDALREARESGRMDELSRVVGQLRDTVRDIQQI